MIASEHIVNLINQAELLPIQQKLANKLTQKPFEISKKTTYEPLYRLLQTFFVTEYPNFKISKEIAQLFFENDVENIQSAYRDFQSYGLMFYSFISAPDVKCTVYQKITKDVNDVVLQKRITRCKDEIFLKTQLEAYQKLKNSQKLEEVFFKGFGVIIAALQILEYMPKDQNQIERMNCLIEEIVLRLQTILPNIKSI